MKLVTKVLPLESFVGRKVIIDSWNKPLYDQFKVEVAFLDVDRQPIDSFKTGEYQVNFHHNGIVRNDAASIYDFAKLTLVNPDYVPYTFNGLCEYITLTEVTALADKVDYDPLVDPEARFIRISVVCK